MKGLAGLGALASCLERWVFSGIVSAVAAATSLTAGVGDLLDRYGINLAFDSLCGGLRDGGDLFSSWQSGRVQGYLKFLSVGAVVLLLIILLT